MGRDELPAILGGAPVRPAGPPGWPLAWAEVQEALQRAFADGSWGKYHGPSIAQLTEQLAEFHGLPFVELCCSGTAAVELALRSLGLSAGDEVILADYDFKGNMVDALTVRAHPVLVDVDPVDFNLSLESVEAAIGPKTRAILVSHLHGGVVPMRQLMELARSRGLRVIEDACQMPGAIVQGRRAGTWGDVGVISFGGSKLLTAGRGGALFTANEQLAQRIRLYCQRGNDAYPLSELQAAVVIPQLQSLDHYNAIRSANVARLIDQLGNVSGLRPFGCWAGCRADRSKPGYYKLGFEYDPGAFDGLSRERFSDAARAEGIALDAGFRSLSLTHSRRRYRAAFSSELAHRADNNVLVLHHPVLLEGEAAMQEIAAALRKIKQHAADIARVGRGA